MFVDKAASIGMLAALTLVGFGCASSRPVQEEAPVPAGTQAPPPADAPPKHAKVAHGHIEIDQKIQFGFDSDVILPVSDPLLNDVASIFKEQPYIKKVEIQGYASSEGDAEHNLTLSDLRARAVMAKLIADGVDASKLTAKGYGIERPIADNSTEEGREKNRRVEFLITDPPQPNSDARTTR